MVIHSAIVIFGLLESSSGSRTLVPAGKVEVDYGPTLHAGMT